MYYYYKNNNQKPLLRGKSHLLFLIFSPYWIYLFMINNYNYILSFIYLFGNFNLFLISSIYHNYNWKDKKSEDIIKKLDYISIHINSYSTMVGIYSSLIYPLYINTLFTFIGIVYSYYSVNKNYKVNSLTYIITPLPALIISGKDIINIINLNNKILLLLTLIQYIFVAFIYKYKYPVLWKNIFGYHEIMHLFTIGGFISSYLLNYNLLIIP